MRITVGKTFEQIIEAYGMTFGMTRDEMASFLLRRAVDDLIRSEALAKSSASMSVAKSINGKRRRA